MSQVKKNRHAKARLLIAGGGTGGHVFAGVSIAEAWIAKYTAQQSDVLFVGARGGIEEKTVPRAGYNLKLLELGALNGVSLSTRIKTLIKIPKSFFQSAVILFKMRPHAVIGVGGYASGPIVLMARFFGFFLGCTTAILEQNVVPGFTNRILQKIVHQVLYAFPIPGVSEGQVTGNPIRKIMAPQEPAAKTPFVIFIFGGSQGAQGMSTLVFEALKLLSIDKSRFHVIHQTGEKDFDRVKALYQESGISVEVHPFIHDMLSMYKRSSLVVCRAGSSTLAELAAVKRTAVLIPFPFASDNHQEKNARIFEAKKAAIVAPQFTTSPKELAKIIEELITDSKKTSGMEEEISKLYKPNAAQAIVNAISTEVSLS